MDTPSNQPSVAIVNMLSPRTAKNFKTIHTTNAFFWYLISQLQYATRLDIVCCIIIKPKGSMSDLKRDLTAKCREEMRKKAVQ